ncbi:MAG: glycerol kinase [Alphaproteobacteria bacterium]|nr:MAG: glycerol kinase [Alphaproteobacteria bacterium]
MTRYILAIDQGTTSSRAMIFDDQGAVVATCQQEITQYFPEDGWVEHDGMEIIRTVIDTVAAALKKLPDGETIAAVGITNQRETTLIWDRKTGEPIHRAIVWQDRRTADLCRQLKQDGHEESIRDKTGLLLDPYFSASKIKWILDHVEGVRRRAEQGELAFGTLDSFILWHLTGGRVHATDVTNASRTLLFNIRDMAWDPELIRLFDIPEALLPEVHACDHHFGDVPAELFGQKMAITGIAGDQQAALIGQDCLEPGQIKATYGTGGFIMMNTGDQIISSQNRLLTTVAYQMGGQVAYALEGSFFSAGSAIQWLRDGLGIIDSAADCEALARSIDSTGGVYMVPAFTGLGAPHWTPEARGTLFGLTRATGKAEIVRAALESVAFQTADLLAAMAQDANISFDILKVDGGMVVNQWLLQFLADILQLEVIRPRVSETTAYGVALIAGLGAGLYDRVNKMSIFYRYHSVASVKVVAEDTVLQKNNWNNAVRSTCYYSDR